MTRPDSMCDNKACPEFGKATRMVGGCAECGEALVRYKTAEDRAWDEASPTKKRLVTYMMLGRMVDR